MEISKFGFWIFQYFELFQEDYVKCSGRGSSEKLGRWALVEGEEFGELA